MEAWDLFSWVLQKFSENRIVTHAFVLMSNHYHWLCSTNKKDVNFDWFQESLTIDFNHSLKTQEILERGFANPVFESSAKIVKLDHIVSLKNAYRYIYRNPVEAGIVGRAEKYPYSTLSYVLGRREEELHFRCCDVMHIISHPQAVLDFVNLEDKVIYGLWK